MRKHELKCWPEPFAALKDGRKTFEFRRDDRGFAVGDELLIYEWDPSDGYRGDWVRESALGDRAAPLRFVVTYVLYGGRFGVPSDFVVMGIKRAEDPND